jgi:hypothetical protein
VPKADITVGRLSSQGSSSLILALMRSAATSARRSLSGGTRFCTDPNQARLTRIDFFKRYADSGRVIFPTHAPTPSAGTIMRDGAEYRFVFDGEAAVPPSVAA